MKRFLVTSILCFAVFFTQAQQRFKDSNGKWGLKDRTGKIIVPGKYISIGQFLKEFAIVENETPLGNLFGVIDTTGKEITEVKYGKIELGNFGSSKYEILIKALDFNFVFCTLIDPKTGKDITITNRYYVIESFENGKAKVEGKNEKRGEGHTHGYIDETGKEVVALHVQSQIASELSQNLKNAEDKLDKSLNNLNASNKEPKKRVPYIFNAPKSDNEILHITENFISNGFVNTAEQAILAKKMNIMGESGLNFNLSLFNFKYIDKKYVYSNEFDVFKVDNIGYGGFSTDEDKAHDQKSLFDNGQSRMMTLKMGKLLNSKNIFYGISLTSSTKNEQTKLKNESNNVAYALLANNSGYKIVKYKEAQWAWGKKDNQEVIAKGKIPQVNADNVYKFSIKKNKNKWEFFLDDNLVHTLTDDNFLYVNDHLGNIIIDGKADIQLINYEFVALKN